MQRMSMRVCRVVRVVRVVSVVSHPDVHTAQRDLFYVTVRDLREEVRQVLLQYHRKLNNFVIWAEEETKKSAQRHISPAQLQSTPRTRTTAHAHAHTAHAPPHTHALIKMFGMQSCRWSLRSRR